MTQQPQTESTSQALLPAGTRLGPVRLAVTDARRALAVWRDLLGLTVLAEEGGAGGEGGMGSAIPHRTISC